MKQFTAGQAVQVRCPQLKADGATASIKMVSNNCRSIVLEFTATVLIEIEHSGGVALGQYVAIIQTDEGFEDLHGNLWEIDP